VVLGGESSEWAEVKSGVPQGSLLGPVLFKVHINDLDKIVELITLLIKFADDTKLTQRVKNEADCMLLQSALDALTEWAATWGMAFNTAKCKVLHVGKNNPRHVYTMGDQQLAVSSLERDIGVLVSDSLKPSEQCSKAAKTANAVLGQIARSFHYRDRFTFVKLYKLYVRPHLEFACTAWSPWTRTDIDCLERVQKRAICMISGMGSASYEDRLKELKMDTLEERRREMDMVETFKMLTGISDVDPHTWFTPHLPAEGVRVTRAAADYMTLRVPPARLELRRNFFSVRVCEPWNRLPNEVRQCKNVGQFKNAYRKWRENLTQAT
jgi:ribonucleases P/MRP protein subunit RPP40